MQFSQTRRHVTLAAILTLVSSAALFAQGPPAQEPAAQAAPPPPIMQASPLLNAIDVNHDGKIDAAELANAPARLKTLDKNADGKLTRDEAGLPPGFGRGAGGPGGRGGRGGAPEPARGGEAGRAAGPPAETNGASRCRFPARRPTSCSRRC